jgi:hypothetical protein
VSNKADRPKKASWFRRIFGDTDASFTHRTIQGAPFLSDRVKDAMAGETAQQGSEAGEGLQDAEFGLDSPHELDREAAIARERLRRSQARKREGQ